MREKSIENKVTKILEKNEFENIKIMQKTGWPDRIYFKNGKCFFIEFKSQKGHLSKIQKLVIQKLINNGFNVYIIKNKKDLKNILPN